MRRVGQHYIRPDTTHTYTEWFYAGKLAVVAVSGDGCTDLDLYVYDPYGRLVGMDDDYSDDCVVRFVPRCSGTYRIKIVNCSSRYGNVYLLGWN